MASLNLGDIRWLAGLLEGEAWFGVLFGKDKLGRPRYPSVRLTLGMTDLDVVERAAHILKATSRIRSWEPKPGNKRVYQVNLTGRRAVAWMLTLYVLMGERRRGQIDKAVSAWKSARRNYVRTGSGKCRNGHQELWYRDYLSRMQCRGCDREKKRRARRAKAVA